MFHYCLCVRGHVASRGLVLTSVVDIASYDLFAAVVGLGYYVRFGLWS